MMCSKPYRKGVAEFGCGQCMPCRLNRRRLWTGRLMLEAELHEANSFATFTYSNKFGPISNSLIPFHMRDTIKRLRYYVGDLRYYYVGEYGDTSGRPHFHAALYGVGLDDHKNPDVLPRVVCECFVCRSWGYGNVYLGTLTSESASYIAGYVTKRMTVSDDPRLEGRHPEFARMSLKPGIGGDAVGTVAEVMTNDYGSKYVVENGDVAAVYRSNGRMYPLGRYLRSKLRLASGFADSKQPLVASLKWQYELREQVKTKDGREARESKRRQVAHRARVLNQISSSKKGTGQ